MNSGSDIKAIAGLAEREAALRVVAESTSRVTPPVLEKALIADCELSKKQAKAVIRDLVSGGELTYTYEFGTTFLELSFNKPVRVSSRVVLKPPGHYFQAEPHDIAIQIKPGAAFGDGRHPTTRLAIRGLEYALKKAGPDRLEERGRVLDIGTGSGILVIAAVGMGSPRGLGIDIDPAARSEATENVSINGLGDRIEISDRYLEAIAGPFFLVTANLRYPTLKEICSCLRRITQPKGLLVFSGIRSHELTDLTGTYARKGFNALWQAEELGWSGLVLAGPGYTRAPDCAKQKLIPRVDK